MQTAGASRHSTSGVDSSAGFSGWRLMLLQVAVLVVTLVAWDVASGWLIRPVLVSSPPEVAETLWRWIEEGTLWEHLWATTQAVIAGFLLGATTGVVAGYLFGTFVDRKSTRLTSSHYCAYHMPAYYLKNKKK